MRGYGIGAGFGSGVLRTACGLAWFCLLFFGASTAVADTLTAGKPVVIALVEKDSDVFYLQARLGNGEPQEFLLDTGSGYLAINRKTLSGLKADGMAEFQRSIRVRLANGVVRPVDVYRIDVLELGEGCVLRNVDAAILPGSTRNIIGMNVLKMVDSFSVSFGDSRLTLNGCDNNAPAVAAL